MYAMRDALWHAVKKTLSRVMLSGSEASGVAYVDAERQRSMTRQGVFFTAWDTGYYAGCQTCTVLSFVPPLSPLAEAI